MSTATMQPPSVKMVIERRARPGALDSFEQWLKELMEMAARSRGLQGSSVLASAQGDYFILLRFASQVDLDAWQASPEMTELARRGDTLATVPDPAEVRTGLETWFALPGLYAPHVAPPKWKMAVVTWLALLPLVWGLAALLPEAVPLVVGAAATTAISVAMLTWVVMPLLAKLLRPWLYARPEQP
jgi:uncharacterized protein